MFFKDMSWLKANEKILQYFTFYTLTLSPKLMMRVFNKYNLRMLFKIFSTFKSANI